jgi:uncharacterized protein (DUF2336 family)
MLNDNQGGLALTADDVHRLLHDKTAQTRVDMTARIGGTYSMASLSTRERAVAEQIFRLLLRDTEQRVRETLAQSVKDSTSIPRDIVLSMARDVEQVSLPILQYSEVLTDDDLLELIGATQEVSRYLAISRRRRVSEAVSDTLLEKGHAEVVDTLVNNSGAVISQNGYDRIIEDYRENERLMQAVSQRAYLPVATVEKLVHIVSSSLADTLKQKYRMAAPPEQIEREVEKTHEAQTLGLIRLAQADSDIEKLISQLISTGRLTPSIILSALCQGNFEFFETALARLSSIPVENARKLITDRGELGFRAIYNKSGLPDAMFPAVKLLLKIVRELDVEGEKKGGARYANRIVERILHYSENAPIENLSYIIALVRRIAQ